jgi:hypothetical protein
MHGAEMVSAPGWALAEAIIAGAATASAKLLTLMASSLMFFERLMPRAKVDCASWVGAELDTGKLCCPIVIKHIIDASKA